MLLSIIIPVYNDEQYLSRCIESLIKKFKKDMEVILIDDGSSDDSPSICDKYADEYNFINVIHQKNQGVGAARNRGMSVAKGKWLMFVDADDFLDDNYGEYILEAICDDYDLFMFEFYNDLICDGQVKVISEEDRQLLIEYSFLYKEIVPGQEYNLHSACSKVFRKEFLDNYGIRFPENIKYGEDMLFMLNVFANYNCGKLLNIPIYHYYMDVNASSVTNRYKPDFENIVNSYKNEVLVWLEKYPQYSIYYKFYSMNEIILFCKYDFFHVDNQHSYNFNKLRMKNIFTQREYSNYYSELKRNNILNEYRISRRVIFWLAIHNQYFILKCIFRIKYR